MDEFLTLIDNDEVTREFKVSQDDAAVVVNQVIHSPRIGEVRSCSITLHKEDVAMMATFLGIV